MDHEGKRERIQIEKLSQVVLVPASTLRVFVEIASFAKGVWWASDIHEKGDTEHNTYGGPYFILGSAPAGYPTIKAAPMWWQMVSIARTIPLWTAQVANETTRKGERWIYMPEKVIRCLVRPLEDETITNLAAWSEYTGALVTSMLALTESHIIDADLRDGRNFEQKEAVQ